MEGDTTTLSDIFALLYVLGTAISLFLGIQAGQTR
jgi:hypothetical protein